jgi:hypothetical protein
MGCMPYISTSAMLYRDGAVPVTAQRENGGLGEDPQEAP